MAVCDLNVNIGKQILDPANHLPLMKMVYSDNILESKFAEAGALNVFNPEVEAIGSKEDLAISQSIRIRFKNYRNPFTSVGIKEVQYADDETCPPRMEVDCAPGCISTENEWRYEDVRFKNEFQVGVTWCVKQKKLLFQDAEQKFSESIEDSKTVFSTVGWSEFVCQAIDNPAPTLLPRFQSVFPTHYFDAGSADRYTTMTNVFNYMKRVFQGRWDSEFFVIADPQFELDMLTVQNNDWHQYNKTGIPTAQGNVDLFVAGGFRPMPALPKLWGSAILIAPDTVSYYPGAGALSGANLNPFQNADGSKYYVVIGSRRSFYHGTVPLMDKTYFPPTCAGGEEAIQQVWMSYYKLLFNEEVFVVAFDQDSGLSS